MTHNVCVTLRQNLINLWYKSNLSSIKKQFQIRLMEHYYARIYEPVLPTRIVYQKWRVVPFPNGSSDA